MVKTVQRANGFLDDCAQAIDASANAEWEEIAKLLPEHDGVAAKPWDITYGVRLLQGHLSPDFDMKETRQ